MLGPTGVAAVDLSYRAVRASVEATCNAAGASQATQSAAYVTMYRAILASKIAAGVDCGNEIYALQNQLGVTV